MRSLPELAANETERVLDAVGAKQARDIEMDELAGRRVHDLGACMPRCLVGQHCELGLGRIPRDDGLKEVQKVVAGDVPFEDLDGHKARVVAGRNYREFHFVWSPSVVDAVVCLKTECPSSAGRLEE